MKARCHQFNLSLLSLLSVLLGVGHFSSSVLAEPSPNIILIMADDFGMDAFRSFRTPELDRMAEDGMSFDQAYSTPLCTPSRVQIMTGQYNFRNYVRFSYLDPGQTTFAHILKSAGYTTCITGKWQLGGNAYAPYAAGFDEYCLWQLTFGGYHERYHNPKVITNGVISKYTNAEYGPRIYTDYALDFIERHKDGPFLLYYPMALPHEPVVPTPDSPGYRKYVMSADPAPSRQKFFADQVLYMDRIVGEIRRKVKALGIADRTLILFTGDNGTGKEIHFEYKGRQISGQKGQTNILGTHVPFIASWSGVIAPASTDYNLLDLTDLLPTLTEIAGVELPPDFITDGISFLPRLKKDPGTLRDWVFCHYDPGHKSRSWPLVRYIHDREWKLYGDGRVFNIASDPLEEFPVARKALSPEVLARLSEFQSVLERMQKLPPPDSAPPSP